LIWFFSADHKGDSLMDYIAGNPQNFDDNPFTKLGSSWVAAEAERQGITQGQLIEQLWEFYEQSADIN
jgi:hypothetical protein